jgi:hypothetical protein
MYKSILAILLVGLLAAPAMAVPPPAYDIDPAGWGNSPLEWDNVYGYCTEWAVWNPDIDDWNVIIGDPTFCCEMTVELWIELHAIMTVEHLFHQFHTISANPNGEYFSFYICGSTSSNNPLNICFFPGLGQDLNYLQFIEDVVGEDNGEEDIALNWAYAVNERYIPCEDIQNWERAYPRPYFCFQIPEVCDWYWCVWGWFWVPYHTDDGYYALFFVVCPSPVL